MPLNALAIAELDALAFRLLDPEAEKPAKTAWPRRGLVFTTTGKTVVSGHSRGKARLDREVAEILTGRAAADKEEVQPMPAWRGHDLRRTVATGLQRLGVRFEVTEAVLNHVSGARSGPSRASTSVMIGRKRSGPPSTHGAVMFPRFWSPQPRLHPSFPFARSGKFCPNRFSLTALHAMP